MPFVVPDFSRPFHIVWTGLLPRIPEILASVAVFVFFVWLSGRVRWLTTGWIGRTEARLSLAILLGRVGGAVTLSAGALLALMFFDSDFDLDSILSFFGFLSVALGFAFRDVLANIIGGVFILWGETFKIGDSISGAGYEGVVEEVKMRATTLQTSDGRRICVPNGVLYGAPLTINSAFENRRAEAEILVPPNASASEIHAVLTRVLALQTCVLAVPAPEALLRAVNAEGQLWVMRFWVNRAENPDLLRVQSEVLLAALTDLETREVFSVKLPNENAT